MSSRLKIVLPVLFCVLFLDQISKYYIVKHIPLGTGFSVIPNYFDLVHVRNTGAAFGFLHDWNSNQKNLVFYVLGFVALVYMWQFLKSAEAKHKMTQGAIGLICAGAVGNIIDRLWRGSVVDFLSVHLADQVLAFSLFGQAYTLPLIWPAFNVADSAICVGVVLLLLSSYVSRSATFS